MQDVKLPPHDIDAEESVIGALLLDGERVRLIENLISPNDFFSEKSQRLYSACLTLRSRGEGINQITVAQELNRNGWLELCGGVAELSHLVSICPTPLDLEWYADIVRRLSVSRQLIILGEKISGVGYKAEPDTNETLNKIFTIVTDFRKGATKFNELVSPKDAANVIYDMIDEYNKPRQGMRWGFRDLDKLTSGIFPEFVIIGARPSVGKTQLLLDIAENLIYQNRKILFCSAEMMIKSLMERKIARELKLDIRRLRQCGLEQEVTDKIVNLAGQVSEQQVYYLPKGVTSQDIYNEAQKMKDNIGLDIVFVDYLQILRDCWQSGKESKNVLVGRACKVLKSLVDDLGIPVVCASQLNRDVEHRPEDQRRPTLADLRESGDIEQDADVVFLLYRNIDSPKVEVSSLLEVKMAKNRQLGDAEAQKLVWVAGEHRYADSYHEEPSLID